VTRARSGHREQGQEQAVRHRGGYFGRAKRCFTAAGLPGCQDQLVDQVRTNHYRKTGFIREFEKVAAGLTAEPEPTFLEKARARWAPPD
jgi:hypothetical protein